MGFLQHAYGLQLDSALVCLHRLADTLYLRQALTAYPTSHVHFSMTASFVAQPQLIRL